MGSVVKALALRTLEPGPLVAELIRLRTTAVPEVEVVFLFTGLVDAIGDERWRIGGLDFLILNDPANDLVTSNELLEPAVEGQTVVTVEFQVPLNAVPPEPDAGAWQPATFDEATGLWQADWQVPAVAEDRTAWLFVRATDRAGFTTQIVSRVGVLVGELPAEAPPPEEPPAEPPPAGVTLTALEIFAAAEPLAVPAPLHPNPQADSTEVPAGVPDGSLALLVIQGVVTAINTEGTEWQIGSEPRFVYTSAGTLIDDAPRPVVGDLVKIVAVRTLEPGPIVAEKIVLIQEGPVDVIPAEVEMLFLFSGVVESAGDEVWTVGGIDFGLIVGGVEPTSFEPPTLGVGDTVIVEFIVGEPAA